MLRDRSFLLAACAVGTAIAISFDTGVLGLSTKIVKVNSTPPSPYRAFLMSYTGICYSLARIMRVLRHYHRDHSYHIPSEVS